MSHSNKSWNLHRAAQLRQFRFLTALEKDSSVQIPFSTALQQHSDTPAKNKVPWIGSANILPALENV